MNSNTRQEAVALLLATGRTIADAAREARVNERTIYRWLADGPEFQRLITKHRDRLFAEAASNITATLADVSSTLKELLKGQSEYVRVKAARALAELGLRLRKDLEVEGRLQDVERQLQLTPAETI